MEQLGPWYQQFNFDGKLTTRTGFMNSDYFREILPLLPDVNNKIVLDLCCNAGLVSFELAKLGARVYGFENDSKYFNQAIYASQYMPNYVDFRLIDVETVDLKNYKPNLVLALSCLYHLKDPMAMIEKISNCDADIVVSFREKLFDKYISYFALFGRLPSKITRYARKYAARLI